MRVDGRRLRVQRLVNGWTGCPRGGRPTRAGEGPMSDTSREELPFSRSGSASPEGETVPAEPWGTGLRCPHCGHPVSATIHELHQMICRECGSSFRVEFVDQPW